MKQPVLETEDVLNVEIFAPGKWNGMEWTREHIAQFVENFRALKGTIDPPLKVGHADQQKFLQGYPAAGWINNLRMVGDKAVADFVKVPSKLAALIKAGSYRKVSSEIYPKYVHNGKQIGAVLAGVALLGGELPAVTSIGDIISNYFALDLDRVTFKGEGDLELEVIVFDRGGTEPLPEEVDEFDALADLLAKVSASTKGRVGAPAMRTLAAETLAKLKRIKDSTKKTEHDKEENVATKLSEATLKVLGLTAEATDAEIDAAIVKREQERVEHATTLESRVLSMENENKGKRADSLVGAVIAEGKALPAQKEALKKFALADPEGFAALYKDAAKVVDFSERGSGADAGDPKDATTEFLTAIEKKMKDGDGKVEYAQAMDLVAAEQPELARRAQTEARYGVRA